MEYVCRVGTPSGEVVERTFSASDERALRTDLEQLPRSLHRIGHQPPFANVVATWFLDIDVLTRVQSQDRGGSVPVIGGGNEHRIDRLVVQNLP